MAIKNVADAGVGGATVAGGVADNNASQLGQGAATVANEAVGQVIKDAELAHGGKDLVGKSVASKFMGPVGFGISAWGAVNDYNTIQKDYNGFGNIKLSSALSFTGNSMAAIGSPWHNRCFTFGYISTCLGSYGCNRWNNHWRWRGGNRFSVAGYHHRRYLLGQSFQQYDRQTRPQS